MHYNTKHFHKEVNNLSFHSLCRQVRIERKIFSFVNACYRSHCEEIICVYVYFFYLLMFVHSFITLFSSESIGLSVRLLLFSPLKGIVHTKKSVFIHPQVV